MESDNKKHNLESFNLNDCEKTFNNSSNDKKALSSPNDESLCSQEKLELSSWGLPERILQFYKGKGISRMFQWQLECLTLGGVLNAGNLVYSAPTSAGKTLVAEILIAKSVFELQKKALIILPFVSVVREKMFYFQGMYASSGIHVEGYMGGHSPSISFQQVHVAVCTIEKANSIINKLLEDKSLQNLGLVVVDELHLLGDPYRGYLLELLLTKLKYISSKSEYKIQIVGMSATLPNLKSLSDWLHADLYYTEFRPVPLIEKLKCGTTLYDKKFNKLSDISPIPFESLDDSESVGQLCLETIANGHSVLIFCPTKVWCENLAEKISVFFKKLGCDKSAETEGTLGWILRSQLNLQKINAVIEHLKMSPVGLDKDLQKTVSYGVAFHHAGLTLDERDIIEGSFRQGSIRVLCATSTLSSGVNLPARRVIIRSPMSFGGLMDILTYRQMIGRAGRMGVDSEGESILICKPNEKSMCQTLMCSNLKPIESCLGHGRLSASLKRALLEIVASGVASTPEEVKNYANCSFLAFSAKHDMVDPIQSCIEFLEENEFIRLQENRTLYVPTPLGKACLASSLPPDEGLALFRELQRARRCFVLDTDLHIIYQVTPYSVSEQWSKVDWLNVLNILESLPASMKKVGELVGVEEAFLVRIVKGTVNANTPENRNKLSIHRRFYTSLALQDLVNEVPLSEVAEKYECNKGMLQSLQQSAATYAGMVTEFTKRLGWGSVELIFSQFQERLQFGIQRELCELMRLPLLNAMRARALFNAGFTNLSSIANANATDLENAFFTIAPFQSKKEIAGETTYDKEQRNKLETVWITGKADLSVRQAVETLISESRNILELELGLEGAQWGRKNNDSSILDKSLNKTVNYSIGSKMNANGSRMSGNCSNLCNTTTVSENIAIISEKDKKELYSNQEAVNRSNKVENVRDIHNVEKIADFSNVINIEIKDHDCAQNKKLMDNTWENCNIAKNQCAGNVDNIPSKEVEPKERNEEERRGNKCVEESKIINEAINAQKQLSTPENLKNKTDLFASTFNFDMILDYVTPETIRNRSNVQKQNRNSLHMKNDNNKDIESLSSESDSNSSVEILYDSSILTKNLSLSRLSEDMFEISRRGNSSKKMSTPIPPQGHKNLSAAATSASRFADTRSPDLFSESLTFDTQLGKILDMEDPPGEDAPVIINPSASFNSDDLGFVSDLSPPKGKLKQVQNGKEPKMLNDNKTKDVELQNVCITSSFFECGFTTPVEEKNGCEGKGKGEKRKAKDVESPDVIVDSDESMTENQHVSKRIKYDSVDNKDISSPAPLNGDVSDDEIMPTPKLDKTMLSNISKISRLRSSSIKSINRSILGKRTSQRSRLLSHNVISRKPNARIMGKSTNNKATDKRKWDQINIIDVCEKEEEFRSFCEALKEQTIVGLALGCRRKCDTKKSIIGAKIMNKKKMIAKKENSSKCHYNDIVLDGIAFYWESNAVYYMSLDDECATLREKIELLKSLCVKQKTFRVFDAKEQIKMLYHCTSVLLTSSYQDPKIASWLLAENWREKNFPTMALGYLPGQANIISLVGSVVGYSSPGLLFKSAVSHQMRACSEAFITYHMINKQLPLLRGKGLKNSFEKVEMPIVLCLAEMELSGFQIHRGSVLEIQAKLNAAKEALEEKAYSLAKQKFNIFSSAAVSKVLLKVLNVEAGSLALTKKTKVPSTSKEALQELANQTNHPLPEIILQWRKIRSVSSKFVSPLLLISSDSSRVYGVSQTFTVTGRISMHEPNLQNIPKNFSINLGKDKASTSISLRDVFVASEKWVLLSADYCQIELRMLAHLSQDKDLIKNINDSSDIFVSIAANIYGVSSYNVDENFRQKIKQTCYGMIYGIGPRALSQQLNISEADAAELMEDFKNKYQGVRNYLEQVVNDCRKTGYVSTLLGRRRYLPAINDQNQTIRLEAERQAINTTIQGSAADLVKTSMISWRENIHDLNSNGVTARLVLHLHDELIFEVQKDALKNVATILKDTMENAMSISVPTPVKMRTGTSWGQLCVLE